MKADAFAQAKTRELVVLLNDDMTHAIEALDLTPSRMHLLWELGQRGPVTERVLADALKVTPRAITGLVDGLVEGGLVTRESHPTDRRATLVTLTASGKKLTAMLKRDHRTLARALFAQMSSAEFDSFERGWLLSSPTYARTSPPQGVGPEHEAPFSRVS